MSAVHNKARTSSNPERTQPGTSIHEKVLKTLAELGVQSVGDIQQLFYELAQTLNDESNALVIKQAQSEAEREQMCKAFRNRWLGRKNGLIAQADENWLKTVGTDWRRDVGRFFNELRALVEEKVAALPTEIRLHVGVDAAFAGTGSTDLTLPGIRRPLGSIHPVTQVMREIEDIFLGLGFSIESGPEIESVYYNFDALNIPESHPARDDWDTIYVNSETVLRTHTSPVQIRAMEKHGAPLYILCPGKAYRHDNPDSTHATMFHQVEGLAVDTDISFADLKGTLDYFAKKFFGDKIKTNFSPSFFPFTEPSGELAISCVFCGGEGCRVCKESGWVEVMGCGMVHPEVLRHGGIDPERYSGWAFGLGVERFAMMKYDINDIQLFHQGDVRFLEQF
jgi:phenylalanyl-tRNA synthetase alpha chain